MKTFELTGTLRSEFGKKAAKGLRKQDQVPCNIYGANGNQTFAVNVADVRKLIYTPDTQIVALDIEGQKRMAVVKELQFHPVKETLFHIDFLEVTDKKPVTVEIPVLLSGHAAGVKAGGKLRLNMRKLKVNGIYTLLPDRVEIDVTELGLGKKINVQDVTLAEGLKLMNAPTLCVAEVKATRQSAQAAAE